VDALLHGLLGWLLVDVAVVPATVIDVPLAHALDKFGKKVRVGTETFLETERSTTARHIRGDLDLIDR
jgi:hypothetical protein